MLASAVTAERVPNGLTPVSGSDLTLVAASTWGVVDVATTGVDGVVGVAGVVGVKGVVVVLAPQLLMFTLVLVEFVAPELPLVTLPLLQ